MKVFSLRLKRATAPQQFHSAVISSLVGAMAVVVLVRTAWPHPQVRTYALAGAIVFLFLCGVALFRIRKLYEAVYPKAEAGDQAVIQALNATMKAHIWGNAGFMLLALAVFQLTLLVK